MHMCCLGSFVHDLNCMDANSLDASLMCYFRHIMSIDYILAFMSIALCMPCFTFLFCLLNCSIECLYDSL